MTNEKIEVNLFDTIQQSNTLTLSQETLDTAILYKKSNKEDKFFSRLLEMIFEKTSFFDNFDAFEQFCTECIDKKIVSSKEIEEFKKRMFVQHRCYFTPQFSSFEKAFSFFRTFIENYMQTEISENISYDLSKLITHTQKYYHSSAKLDVLNLSKKYENALTSQVGPNRFNNVTFAATDNSIKEYIPFYKLLTFRFHIRNNKQYYFFLNEILSKNSVVLNIFKNFQYILKEKVDFTPNGFNPEILFPVENFENDVSISIVPSVNIINYIQYLLMGYRYHSCRFPNGLYNIVGSNAQNISDQALFYGGQLKTIKTDLSWYKKNNLLKSNRKYKKYIEPVNMDYLKNDNIPNRTKISYLKNLGERIFNEKVKFWLNDDKLKYKENSIIYNFLSKKLTTDEISILVKDISMEYQKNNDFYDGKIKKFVEEGIENGIYVYLSESEDV